jgi:hypothetical protein
VSRVYAQIPRSPVQIGTLLLAALAVACLGGDCPGWERINAYTPTPGHCMRLRVGTGAGALTLGEACPAAETQCVIVSDGETAYSWTDESELALTADDLRIGVGELPVLADGSCPPEVLAACD